VGKRWILTAGTCVYNAVAFTIYLGSVSLDGDDPNRMILATNDYEIHPEFNPETLENDVGLVKLRMEITYYTTYVSQVRFMPTSVLPSSAFVVALGWGQVSDGKKIENNYIFYENIIMCIVGCLPTRNMFINVFFNSFAKPALYNNNCYLISLQMIMCRIMIFITLM
jgi:hypothetical protein